LHFDPFSVVNQRITKPALIAEWEKYRVKPRRSPTGCRNPLVVIFAVLVAGIILFESIHAIGSLANRWADAELNSFLAYPG
jgi:hypothetical protein